MEGRKDVDDLIRKCEEIMKQVQGRGFLIRKYCVDVTSFNERRLDVLDRDIKQLSNKHDWGSFQRILGRKQEVEELKKKMMADIHFEMNRSKEDMRLLNNLMDKLRQCKSQIMGEVL